MTMQRTTSLLTLILLLGFATTACDSSLNGSEPAAKAAWPETEAVRAPQSRGQLVEVRAVGHHEFELSTDEVPSGWTTFRLDNASHAVHFALVEKLPSGITIEDYEAEVAPVFQNLMDSFSGEEPSAPEAGSDLPAWYGNVVFTGGPGFTVAGQASQATMYLEPGTYLVECYVKTQDGEFHSYLGMVEQLVVTEEVSRAREPKATLEMTLSTKEGIEVSDEVRPGMHTVAAYFEDQTAYSHFLGHDVQLVRLGDETNLDELAAWMDWTQPGSLAEPAPAEFVGGIQDMPAGTTGYFTVHLKPGRYAWIAEVPDPAANGMLKTFTVPPAGRGLR